MTDRSGERSGVCAAYDGTNAMSRRHLLWLALLDETPMPIVVMAVEEAASRAHVSPRRVWRNVAKLAKALSVHRQGLWA